MTRVDEDRLKKAIDLVSQAFVDAQSDNTEKLRVCAWIVGEVASHPDPGMTEGWHVVDVVTRIMSDISSLSRGRLLKNGNDGYPRR